MKLVYSCTMSPDLFTTYSDADLSGNPDNSCSMGLCGGGHQPMGESPSTSCFSIQY